MSFIRQLRILLWKNLLLKKAQPWSFAFELLLPAILMVFMVLAKLATTTTVVEADLRLDEAVSFNYTASLQMLASQQLSVNRARIAFVPNNSLTQDLAARLQEIAPFAVTYFQSNDDLNRYVRDPNYGYKTYFPGFCGAIVINKWNAEEYQFAYSLRMNSSARSGIFRQIPDTTIPQTNDLSTAYESDEWQLYYNQGFLALQGFMDNYILNVSGNGTSISSPEPLNLQPFPTPRYTVDDFATYVAPYLGLYFTLVYIWPVTRLVKAIVEEKELRIKEGMKMMGLRDSASWISWFITYFCMFVFTSLLIVAVTPDLYKYSNKFLIFVFFQFFGMAVFSFCYFLSVFFTRARIASTLSALLFMGMFFGSFALSATSTKSQRTAACLAPNIAFGNAAVVIANLEANQIGLNWDSVTTEYQNFSFSIALYMLFIDMVVYLLLGLYLEMVLPSTYGVRQPWYFLCSPKYWNPRKYGTNASSNDKEDERLTAEDDGDSSTVEAVGPELRGTEKIRLSHLRKEYHISDQPEPVVALKDLSLSLYDGQILSLLGHNGAGKTTTINMLTGLYEPSSGNAFIYGKSIREDMQEIREMLGVCPQHDILFPLLTVAEHLELYAVIKGVPKEKVSRAVTEMICQVGLTEKRNVKAGTLSGGQMRKLSVGIALIGDSKVVFLDEPTSGMDPYSRRFTWDLLRKARKGRVMVLTTHFMDEADQLGDRIAIMAKGELRCCGSSLFLKSHYGVGYTLTLVKKAGCDEDALVKLCKSHVESCSRLSSAANELALRLPFESSAKFPELFKIIEEKKDELLVDNYGISVTTLEEVFLRVADADEDKSEEKSEDQLEKQRSKSLDEPVVIHTPTTPTQEDGKELHSPVKGDGSPRDEFADASVKVDRQLPEWKIAASHFRALLVKRWHSARRDRKQFLWQIVYPFLILLAGLAALKVGLSLSYPVVDLNTSHYNTPLRIPYNSDSLSAVDVMSQLLPSEGVAFGETGINDTMQMNQYLLDSIKSFKETRYGAYIFGPNETVFWNTTAAHGLPVFYNLYNNLRLRSLLSSSSAQIVASNDPMPPTAGLQIFNTATTCFVVTIAYAFIPATFASFIVKERSTKAKHLQMISGVSTFAFWFSSWVWDFLNYLLPALLTLALLGIFNVSSLIGPNTGATFLVMIMFGFSICPFQYLISFFFDNPSSAQNMSLMLNFLGGTVLVIVSIVLQAISDVTRDVFNVLVWFFRLLPSYCFGDALANLSVRESPVIFGESQGAFDMNVIGKDCLFMFWEMFVYFGLVLLIEKIRATPTLLSYFRPTPLVQDKEFEEDEDVIAERERILKGEADNEMIRLKGLRKVYPSRLGQPPKVAVKNLYFSIPKGQCFGFLGINGAGKSTALKMLTGDEIPSSGTAILNNLDILTEQIEVRRVMGYCPQFDALLDNLTAREHLFLYARIKCVPEEDIPEFVDRLLTQLTLQPYADKPAGTYSGGNKRKLSVGIALIGNPPIVFLDEPSTGMDPKSRRFMWNLISSTMAQRSVILTTHSMEECEALCQRIAILVGGRLRCIGSAQHLKSRYGNGWQITFKLKSEEEEVKSTDDEKVQVKVDESGGGLSLSPLTATTTKTEDSKDESGIGERAIKIQKWMEQTFVHSDVKLIETDGSLLLTFRLSKPEPPLPPLPLSQLFQLIEANRDSWSIEAYSVSETSLEQIFLHFAKQQEEETGKVAGLFE